MKNESKEAFAIGFSTEEVARILELMQLPEMPEFHPDDLNRLPEEQKQLALQVAHRGLVARQILLPDEQGSLQPHPIVLSLFLANIMPQHTILLVEKSEAKTERIYFFHSLENIHVVRWVTPPGVHEFLLLPDRAALQKALIDLINLKSDRAPDWPSCTVDARVFERALDVAAQQGRPSAETLLKENDVTPEAAAALAASMASRQVYQTLIAVRNDGTQVDHPGVISLMRGVDGAWLVKTIAVNSGSAKIHLEPASRAELVIRVERLMADY